MGTLPAWPPAKRADATHRLSCAQATGVTKGFALWMDIPARAYMDEDFDGDNSGDWTLTASGSESVRVVTHSPTRPAPPSPYALSNVLRGHGGFRAHP
jgi:hypothetical protein